MLKLKGKPVYRKLKTFFIFMERLILSLKREDFSGTIYLNFPQKEGYFFILEGDIVGGVLENEGKRLSGSKAVQTLLELAQKEEGLLWVDAFPYKIISILSTIFSIPCNTIYQHLSSEFSHLGMLLSKLKNKNFSGYIEVNYQDSARQELVILNQGQIKHIFSLLPDPSTNHINIVNNDLKIVKESQEKKAFFNVYELT
ncbi:MAG TPA: hypothetical protein DIT19_01110 [Desulfonauticus sp.]|jgi:hypothetical protein|nr:MAG: PATAN domain protein [Desulfonauticus sp. 38_4375]MDK2922482.1 hypothetical protein [Desulfonauticus sp.]HCO11811.1 hypothetical protein [Desulfonauticus sp.]